MNIGNILNQVARAINSTDKNVVIETTIALLIQEGLPVEKAYDLVMGDGAYVRLASEIWQSAQAGA